jgi:SAM-dependent methyltransferase
MIDSRIFDKRDFYDHHVNFVERKLIDYEISPGTMAKFNIIKTHLGSRQFQNAADIGCSGNSILPFLEHITNRFYLDIARNPLRQFNHGIHENPVVAVIEQMGIKTGAFDLICALDVIEHVKFDRQAIEEIIRLLRPGGILLISVPHRKKFYTYQDTLIGHYRRYELDELTTLVTSSPSMRYLSHFGIYGQLMQVQRIQAANPDETENSIYNLRKRYRQDPQFRKIWSKIVQFGCFWMKMDAKFQPLSRIMNLAVIFKKIPSRGPSERRATPKNRP